MQKEKVYYLIYKPFQVLSQFSSVEGKATLKDYFDVELDVYPVGRLDFDSEGLLLLTNDGSLNAKLLHPDHAHVRSYCVQVEGTFTEAAKTALEKSVTIAVNGKQHQTAPCKVSILHNAPDLPERNPPIRFRKNVPDSWIRISLTEGKNRQVRKMTAAVGFPTLRLVRTSIENLHLDKMKPGDILPIQAKELMKALNLKINRW